MRPKSVTKLSLLDDNLQYRYQRTDGGLLCEQAEWRQSSANPVERAVEDTDDMLASHESPTTAGHLGQKQLGATRQKGYSGTPAPRKCSRDVHWSVTGMCPIRRGQFHLTHRGGIKKTSDGDMTRKSNIGQRCLPRNLCACPSLLWVIRPSARKAACLFATAGSYLPLLQR